MSLLVGVESNGKILSFANEIVRFLIVFCGSERFSKPVRYNFWVRVLHSDHADSVKPP